MPLRHMMAMIGNLRRSFKLAAEGFFGPIPDESKAAFDEAAQSLERLDQQLRQSFEVRLPGGPNGAAEGDGQKASQLTAREREIVRLMSAGYHNSEIAKRLNYGLGTIKAHVRAILEKLGATSRTEAVAIAERKRII
ncbi:MAG: response regulator transcription factor [Candidatus Eremiobacteraeota bacterium]|nr:response regulator transcription factor [Candidatus Eremiobacteraeota bacterium]MBV8364906.1 response regulator transcription factor [Candidatus Eremiobacteraeota bacterium]